MLSIVVAVDRCLAIGIKNGLPWHLPLDLQLFKQRTVGGVVIMGRRTYESIGRPLPGRTNIVLTHQESWAAKGVDVIHALSDLKPLQDAEDEYFIIGGARIYQQTLSMVQKMYITEVDIQVDADAYFPEWSQDEWLCQEKDYYPVSDKNHMSFSVSTWVRV